jgi:predicted PurR-regulated permease PerM
MAGRSGPGIGHRARQLLTAAREGVRSAEERRTPVEHRGAAGEHEGASGPVPPDGAATHGNGVAGPHPPGVSGTEALPGAPGTEAPPGAPGTEAPPGEPTTEAPPGARAVVPYWLQVAGGWAWRLLFIGLALYVLYRVAGRLALVVIPCAAALLLTALLQPLTARLHRRGMPMLAATWCTLLGAVIVLAGTITLVTIRVRAEYKGLVTQVRHTSRQIETWLAGPPLHLKTTSLQASSNKLLNYLGQHKSLVAGTVLTGGQIVFEVLGGIVLMLFVTFFLIKDGVRIWAWLTSAFGPDGSQRANRAGRAAWHAVVAYVRGTVLVAAIHAVVIGSALTIMGAPLVAPLAVLVFLAAFIPLVGILFAGSVIILITLATKGWIAAVVLLGVFIVENQLESHLLQPLVVGRIIRLHPLAIILVLAVGGIVAGIPGAVVAVPVAAAITRAVPELRRRQPDAVPVPAPGDQGPPAP